MNRPDTSKSNSTNLASLCPNDSYEIIFCAGHESSRPSLDGRSVNIKRLSKKKQRLAYLVVCDLIAEFHYYREG